LFAEDGDLVAERLPVSMYFVIVLTARTKRSSFETKSSFILDLHFMA